MAVISGPPPSSPPHSSLLLLAFSLALLSFLFVSFYLKKKKNNNKKRLEQQQQQEKPISTISLVAASCLAGTHQQQDLPKWAPVTASSPSPILLHEDQSSDCSSSVEVKKERDDKKRKKRARKKKQEPSRPGSDGGEQNRRDRTAGKHGEDCIYPFSSFSSATQRRIKQQYDQLVKSNQAKALTVAQVGQFANCLIEARNELQHKSEIIQRRFTIKRALLSKADRSSIDRLCQQIYKLEAEQKRLEEDAIVYNRLQEQLKLSPAYKTMLEIGARMESNASSEKAGEDTDSEFTDISFEELLAQEKKDSFWQRNGRLKSSSS